MTLILGILQFLAIIILCVYELNKKSVAIFLWATLLIMFGIMHLISILMGSYVFSRETMNKASIFVILFSTIYFATRCIMEKLFNKKNDEKIVKNEKETKQFMYVLFIILIVIVSIRIITLSRGAGGIINTSWETMRTTVTQNQYLSFSQIFLSLFFAGSTCMILAIEVKNRKVLILSILIVLIEVLISRNRIEILPILVTFIYYYIKKKDKISIKLLVGLAIMGVLSIYLIYGMRVFRRSGSFKDFFAQYTFGTFNKEVGRYLEEDDGELGLRKYYYYFIENNNKFNNFNKGHTYIRMAMVLIPSKFSLGLKPDDFAITMGSAINNRIKGFSIHPTLLGDVYANFGVLGVFMGIFWGAYVFVLDKISNTRNYTKSSIYSIIICISLIIQGRGSVYNAFASLVLSIILLKTIYLIFKWVKNSIENKKISK